MAKVITSEELKMLPIEQREKIIDKMTIEELYEHLGIKPLPKLARKHPHETAAQVVRRLRIRMDKGAFVW